MVFSLLFNQLSRFPSLYGRKNWSCTADFFSLPLLYQVVAGFGFYSNWCGGTQIYFIGLFIIWKNAAVADTLIWL